MISAPLGNSFRTTYSNITGLRPSVTNWGTSITPGNNTKGTATGLGVTCTKACYGILVGFMNSTSSGNVRNGIADIVMDPAGGTTYTTTLLPNLISGPAGFIGGASPGGFWYYFPIYIPADATLACQASVNNATVGTVACAVVAFADPVHPENLLYGHRCEAIGAVTASSQGTSVTPGTTSDGTWTSLGSSTQNNLYFTAGVTINNGTITAMHYTADLSADNDTTTPHFLARDISVNCTSLEQMSFNALGAGVGHSHEPVVSGTTIYGRMQASGTAVTGITMIAYGVG